MIISALIFFLLFCFLAWRNFRLSLLLLFILFPAYLLRFNIGPIPSTFLELSFGAVFLMWLIKYSRDDFKNIKEFVSGHKVFFIFVLIFFISSVISIFISDMWLKSLGQWRAYFLEPMILFLILFGRKNEVKPHDLIFGLALSTLSISVYSIYQAITGMDRVTAFFTSPNSVGLYLGPIIPLMVIFVIVNRARADFRSNNLMIALIVLSLIALFFTVSQGAWVAVGAGAFVFLFGIGHFYRKIAIALAILGIIVAFSVSSIRTAVLFQDKAGQNRLRLWSYSAEFLTASPKNFVFGSGIRQFFRKIQKPHYNVEEMERLIYPHNIFLNFWTEIGLLGMTAFSAIVFLAFRASRRIAKYNIVLGSGLAASLVVILIHGLVDVPYFKNDLAMIFWIIMAIIFISDAGE